MASQCKVTGIDAAAFLGRGGLEKPNLGVASHSCKMHTALQEILSSVQNEGRVSSDRIYQGKWGEGACQRMFP